MKWFKHENTFNNPKVKLLKRKHKALGYAVYFQVLELIGDSLDVSKPDEWFYLPKEYTDDTAFFADEIGVSVEELHAILDTCFTVNLLQIDVETGRIRCEQLRERSDEYTEKIIKKMERVGTKSGQDRDKIQKSPPRIDKNRIDNIYTKKENKKKKESSLSLTEKKTSKNSQTLCTKEELQEIADSLHVKLLDVERVHATIADKLAEGSFEKKYKTVYYTLKQWVRMGIERGTIHEITSQISQAEQMGYKKASEVKLW